MSRIGKLKSSIKTIVFLLVAVLLIFGVFFVIHEWDIRYGNFEDIDFSEGVVYYDGAEYVLNNDIETFLVICLDKKSTEVTADSYNNNKQADFLMLFVFDNEQKTTTAIQIDRDTMTEMNILGLSGDRVGTVEQQISFAHTYGNGREVSCRNTLDAVSNLLLGVKLRHYISLTMDSVTTLNDLVGGVEVTVLDDFSNVDDTLIKGEKVLLMGDQALTYVRARSSMDDSTNIARMKRQRQYIEALYGKAAECAENNVDFVVEATVKMSEFMISDRSLNQLQELANKLKEYEFVEIRTIEGESKVGDRYMEFYPDNDAIAKMVIDLFYELKK